MLTLIRSRFFKILLIIIVGLLAYRYYQNYAMIRKLEATITELENSLIMARGEKTRLEEELNNINNPEYIERIAREELGLVKPGELLLIPVEE
ncbi:MAG TPA: septum formation initiator family protein [Halanaerobiaceae bacterium]|nr:septum formation initiator family protein [Bacillota bacterium]HHU93365.1 septum formation initiator family protein [Halanaerobiaceae bacterium]HOA40875.1 septum formation initiator family protein [Halanaerobiales bacterium]HPZ62813.1 septum formation initiator family protein [Halanaerobiales bacterium]HQD04618.1 septum formation initiator family protein [Halanaerobiales bacterium]